MVIAKAFFLYARSKLARHGGKADSYAEIVHVVIDEFKIEAMNPAIKDKVRDVRLYPFAETDEHREIISRSFRKD